jgi:hypothetical protein
MAMPRRPLIVENMFVSLFMSHTEIQAAARVDACERNRSRRRHRAHTL